VNGGNKLGRRFKNLSKGHFIANVNLVKDEAFLPFILAETNNLGDPVQGDGTRVNQIVHHHNRVALLEKNCDGMSSNVPASTRHEDNGSVAAAHRQSIVNAAW
jgi:hypothetical protein